MVLALKITGPSATSRVVSAASTIFSALHWRRKAGRRSQLRRLVRRDEF